MARNMFMTSSTTPISACSIAAAGSANKPVREAFPDLAGQGFYELLDQVFETGERVVQNGTPLRYRLSADAAPQERFVNFVYAPITDADGRVTGIFCEGFDATEAHLAHRELEQSRQLLEAFNAHLEREIFERSGVGGQFWEISPDLLCVLKPNSYFARTNPAWVTTLGWTEAEMQARPFLTFLHPEDVEHTRHIFEYLKGGNPILRFENRYRCKDGSYRWIAWAAAPLAEAYYCSGRDITAEKEQSAVIAAKTAELARIWQQSRDVQVIIGSDGVFRSVNPAWTDILGHPPAEVIGRSFLDFILPEDADFTRNALDIAAKAKNLSNLENRYRHQDGSLRWMSWHTSTEGDLVYAYGRDITAEKTAQLELAQAQEALRQSQKMEAVGQLTGGLAHDFNNLLAGISGSLELLLRRLKEGRLQGVERYIEAAQSNTRRAAALTQRLLAFSRRQTLDPKPTDVNRLIQGMEELIRRSVGPAVALEVVGAGGLWITRIDASQLENAVLNLCINGRDAMAPAGGRLTIETANKWLDARAALARELPPGEYVCISVTDTGSGMTPGVIERAFEPFFTTKPLGQGTGLGLSMTYGFVRQSGGQVRIYSEPGTGTTISLYLPRFTGDPAGPDDDAPPQPVPRGETAGETVLVVDDEHTIRMLLVEILSELGYRCIEAVDGQSALRALAREARIDLLITDVGLPGGLNGRQIADAARQTRPALKILFITGYAENAVIGNGHLDPGMEVITKPFVVTALAEKIRDMMAR
jgi:PAS domain S-box-containing protein